ncbi:MAG: hypothetical protein R3F07_16315 [Opitutaceae bacterium]
MKAIRIAVSLLVLVSFMRPIVKSGISVLGGGFPTMLPANLVFGLIGLGTALLILPGLRRIWKNASVLLVAIGFVGTAAGIVYETHRIENLAGAIRETGGLGYVGSEEVGYWITDEPTLDRIAGILEDGESRIEWRGSSWFWINGGKACACHDGKSIRFRDGRGAVTLKHDCFQILGFVQIRNSNSNEFVRALEDALYDLGFWEAMGVTQIDHRKGNHHNQASEVTAFSRTSS